MTEAALQVRSYLIPIAGPQMPQFTLRSDRAPLLLGRHESCQLLTPADEERISRFHARFDFNAGRWFIVDQKSTWGTFLNGYRLPPAKPYLLSEGDLLRITPWTFSFRSTPASDTSVRPRNDAQQAMTIIRPEASRSASSERDPLGLLIEASAGIHRVEDEQTLAELVVDFARRGTFYRHVAYLRPAGADARVEIVASVPTDGRPSYSRSLLEAASQGEVALLDPASGAASQSVISLRISSALCVPLMLGGSIAAYLYLDSRDGDDPSMRYSRDQDFCLAISRVASLALANIKRVEIERRQASLDSQLEQAAAIQQYILPPRQQRVGDLLITGQSRPGQFVGGDFFDVIALPNGRVALTLGDVSGKGVAASVLMTTIHGFLHALLEAGTPLADAVMRLNVFLEPRKPEERFATLFAAIIDTQAQSVTYLDAAHGYGLLWSGGSLTPLSDGGGPPVGAFADLKYEAVTVPFHPGDALLAVSDGIIEQPQASTPGTDRQQFETSGILRAMQQACAEGADEVATLFAAVESHAGQAALADDATILLAKWC